MNLSLVDGSLVCGKGSVVLSGVGAELSVEGDGLGHGVFLIARKGATSSRLRFDLGGMPGLRRFSACHRYEPFWMEPCAGTGLAEVPPETQALLVELEDGRFV